MITLLAIAASIALERGAGRAADYFSLIEAAPVVAAVRIDNVQKVPEPPLVLYRFTPSELLKGRLPPRLPEIVQEVFFRSDVAWLSAGDVAVIALEPFPLPSRYRQTLTGSSYLRVAGGREGIRSKSSVDLVRNYVRLIGGPDPAPSALRVEFLAAAVTNPELGNEAVGALERWLSDGPTHSRATSAARKTGAASKSRQTRFGRPSPLPPGSTTPALSRQEPGTANGKNGRATPGTELRGWTPAAAQALGRALTDNAVPVERRRRVLDLIAAYRLEGVEIWTHRALDNNALAPFARRTLAALGQQPSEKSVRDDLRSADPKARMAALDSLLSLGPQQRLALLAETATRDSDVDVRIAAVERLAGEGRGALASLSSLLGDTDPRFCYHVAQAVASIGDEEAVTILARQFESGSYETQVAAVFALRRIGSDSALGTLARVRTNPPDPRLVDLIDLAVGAPAKR